MREQVKVYVPDLLVRYFLKRVRENPQKFRVVEKAIDCARFPLTVQRLYAIALFYSLRVMSFEKVAVLSASAFIIPLLVLIEIRSKIIGQIENRIPDMFRELAILNEAGLNIIEALKVLTSVEFGIMSRGISLLRGDIEWRDSVIRAFKIV